MAAPRVARLRSFLNELRRRRVFRATAVYVITALAVLQAASVIAPALHLADWTMTFLVFAALAGLPIVIGLAWVFDVVPTSDGSARARVVVSPREPPAGLQCIAVVPFINLSGDAENEIFVDGVTEDVIAALSKIRALRVIARTSVMPFKNRELGLREIAERLGATTLLDGSVRRVGDRVRIVAELVDAQTEQHIWAETYDRQLTDIFAIQSDVALQIAGALRAELSSEEQTRIRKEPTGDIAAYQLYQHGRHWLLSYTPEGNRRAIEFFNRAIAVDRDYALAYVGLARGYADLVESGNLAPEDGRPRAIAAVNEALRLDPALGDAYWVLAHLTAIWDFDWPAAESLFQKALALDPNNADAYSLYGRICNALERYDEALTLHRRAQELDPLAHRVDVANVLLRAGRYAEAETEAARAVEFDPGYDRAHATLGWAQLKLGKHAEGLASIARAAELTPGNPQWLAQLGQARAVAGDSAGARAVLEQLHERARTSYLSPYHQAFVHVGLGEYDRALDLLEEAAAQRAAAVYGMKGSFLFAPLRGHPRFEALLQQIYSKRGS